VFERALTWSEEALRRQLQLIQLLVVPDAWQQEPKYFSNGCYIQSLGSYNTFDIAGMSNLSLLGFHILDMQSILFLSLPYLLLLLLLIAAAAAAPQFPLPSHLLLPTALQHVVLDITPVPPQKYTIRPESPLWI
jgi:hypothetical protein